LELEGEKGGKFSLTGIREERQSRNDRERLKGGIYCQKEYLMEGGPEEKGGKRQVHMSFRRKKKEKGNSSFSLSKKRTHWRL